MKIGIKGSNPFSPVTLQGLYFFPMRYHYEKPHNYITMYGSTYICDHPVYSRCTLYLMGKKGLAVIQQRIDETKRTYWTEIDPWLVDQIYLQPGFLDYFKSRAYEASKDGLYPTVTVRQIMWALRMKPIKRERWETVFDRKLI